MLGKAENEIWVDVRTCVICGGLWGGRANARLAFMDGGSKTN